jgi:hypothetical protein
MKTKMKFIVIAILAVLVATVVLTNASKSSIAPGNPAAGSANDLTNSKLSPDLRDVLARAGPTQLIVTWVELDKDEYANRAGASIGSLINRYGSNGEQKIQRKAYAELLPEETVAAMCMSAKGVEPPVQLVKQNPHLEWYMEEMTPNMVTSIANFSGIQGMSLAGTLGGNSKVDPILLPYVAKVAEEYPTYSIKLLVDLRGQSNPSTGGNSDDYGAIAQVLQKYGGEIANRYESVHSLLAIVPANSQLIGDLSTLDEVAMISPNLCFYCGW